MIAHAQSSRPSLRIDGVVDCNPPELFQMPPSTGWLVAHCKPRQEKAFCRELELGGIPRGIFYQRRIRSYPGKGKQESLIPLLGGYVFCLGNEDERDTLFRSGRVVHVMVPRDPAALAHELHQLALLVTRSDGPLLVNPEIMPGTLVTITQGTLSGLSGVVIRRKGVSQLFVNLTLLGTSVSVELPAETAEIFTGF